MIPTLIQFLLLDMSGTVKLALTMTLIGDGGLQIILISDVMKNKPLCHINNTEYIYIMSNQTI